MTQLAADNFTTGGRGSPNAWSPASDGNNWTVDTGSATLSVVSNQGKATAVTTLTIIHLGSATSADFDVTARVKVNSSNYTMAGVMARQTATNTAYLAGLSSNGNTFGIVKVVAGTSTNLSLPSFTVALNTLYWIRFRGIGPNLWAMIWQDGATAPTAWTASAYDTAISSSGTVGLCVSTSNGADIALFDNFSGNTVFPTTPGVSVLVGTATSLQSVMVREGSFEIDDSINAMSTCSFTLRDDTGLNHYQKAQQIYVNDHLNGLMFSGVLNSSQEQNIRPNPLIMSRVDCQDNHYFPAKRTYVGPEYSNQYAGLIATDLLNVLAVEGITAQYASRRETTQAQFALGTLSNTVATTNDLSDGDLELALAGSTVTYAESTTANFSTGSLTSVIAANNTLQPTSTNAIKMVAVMSVPGASSAYTYVKVWSGSQSVTSGNHIAYELNIDPGSPEAKFTIDIIFSDGTKWSDTWASNGSYADVQSQSPLITTDLTGLATGQWYHRDFYLNPYSGKTISSIQIACGGLKTGTFTAWWKNIILADNDTNSGSGYTTLATFFGGTLNVNPAQQLQNFGYSSTVVSVVATYNLYTSTAPNYGALAFRDTSSISIDAVKLLKTSFVSWVADVPTNTVFVMKYSLDGGLSYTACTNNTALPNLPAGLSVVGKSIIFEEQFYALVGASPEVCPTLHSLSVTFSSSYNATKSDVTYSVVQGSGWTAAGTMLTNTANQSGNGSDLTLNGYVRNWDNGSDANQTLYAQNASQSINNRNFQLAITANSDARSRQDYAGSTWQNFTAEVDIQIPSALSIVAGIEYRTTSWGTARYSFAYAMTLSQTTLTLNRGGNSSGAGPFTPVTVAVASATFTLSAGTWHRLKVVLSGSTHKAYLDDVLLINTTDATYSSAGYVALYANNATGSAGNVLFDNFGVTTALSGTWVSPNTLLTAAATYGNSIITWRDVSASYFGGSNTSILVEASINGGSTWQTCTSGSAIPNFTAGQSLSGVNLKLRITLTSSTASAMPGIDNLTVFVLGGFNATGTRISPLLSLLSVGRLGNSLVAWDATLPTGTTLGVDTSINGGSTWTDVTSQNGVSIPGLTVQPDATIDTFDSNTATNYSQVNGSGSYYALRAFAGPVPLNGLWTWDTANSRVTVVATALSLLIYNAVSTSDMDLLTDSDYSDTGGLIWSYTNTSNYYDLVVQDASSSGGTPNSLAVYKVSSGTRTLLASSSISFVRTTYHRTRVTMLSGVITAYFDGIQVLTYTDGSPLTAGKCGLRTGVGTAHFYQLRVQPLGQDVTAISVLTRFRLGSTDPTVTPQVLDSTLAAYGNTISKGALIPSTQYNFKDLASCFDDLVKQSSSVTGNQWWWYIDKYKKFSMLPQTGMPSPWVASDNPGDFLNDVKITNLADLYRNRQIIKNVIATVNIDESHSGDGVSRSWTLGYALSAAPTITVNGVAANVGVKGTDTGKDFYYAVGSATITQDSNDAILISTQTLRIVGTGQYTTYSQYDDTAEQARLAVLEGGSGIVENVEDGGGISKAAGDQLAQARVKQYSIRGLQLEATTRRYGLAPGQILPVILPEHALIDVQFLIRQVKTHLTTEYDPAQGAMIQHAWQAITAVSGSDIGDWTKLYQLQQ